jgi:hypothetical protein
MTRLPALQLALVCCVLLAAPVSAGTLCGSVTDRQSGAPVAHAGIFLRTPAGAYTGIAGATDALGDFCLSDIPAATYDIEVRVDDHQVAYLRGVVVTESTTGVEIGAAPARVQLAAPSPNPARATTRLGWTLAEPARVTLSIYDVRGRYVRGWTAPLMSPGAHSLDWDLNDSHGRSVPPGTYFLRLDAGGTPHVRTLIRTR